MGIINVFIIDDDDATSFLIESLLKKNIKSELSIHKYNSVEKAIANKEIQPEIIILDHFLKLTDGIEALPVLLKYIPNASITILSSQTDIQLFSKAVINGVNRYIKKDRNMFDKISSFVEQEIQKLNDNEYKKNNPLWNTLLNLISSKPTNKKNNEAKKIAIIDDDNALIFKLEYQLTKNTNLKIDTFSTLKSFITKSNYTLDIIVLDYQIGNIVLNKTAILIIKATHPNAKLFCFSSNLDIDVAISLKNYGIDLYFEKSRESTKAIEQIIYEETVSV